MKVYEKSFGTQFARLITLVTGMHSVANFARFSWKAESKRNPISPDAEMGIPISNESVEKTREAGRSNAE